MSLLPTTSLMTLFPYRDEVRKQIHLIKAGRCQGSLKSFCSICLDHSELSKIMPFVDYVMPAPSSLYSRLRGKYDLSYYFTKQLSQRYQLPMIAPPSRLFWNLRKRSQTKNRKDKPSSNFQLNFVPFTPSSISNNDDAPKVLIVDDVVTTGETFRRIILSTSYPQKDLLLLSLCDAR